MFQYQSANEPKTRLADAQVCARPDRSSQEWDPRARNVIKINVDGALNPSTGAAAIGVIARDHEGNPHIMA
jgi:hypothetical protein